MRALVPAVLLLVQITAGAADGPWTGVTALVWATVIDGTGSKPFRDAVVLVSGESIGAVGLLGEGHHSRMSPEGWALAARPFETRDDLLLQDLQEPRIDGLAQLDGRTPTRPAHHARWDLPTG